MAFISVGAAFAEGEVAENFEGAKQNIESGAKTFGEEVKSDAKKVEESVHNEAHKAEEGVHKKMKYLKKKDK